MRLLQRTIRGYLVYSIFVLLIAIPAFYFTIQNILRHQNDEQLVATRYTLKPKLQQIINELGSNKIYILDNNISVEQSLSQKETDSLYTIELYDSIEMEMIPYRFIKSNLLVDGKAYMVTRKMSLMEDDDLIKSILKVQVLLLVLLLGGLILINRNLSIKIWKPFYATLGKLHNYQVEKDTSLGLTKSNINEFDDLNVSLENLASRSHAVFTSQKEFTENASHEMQTPLAIMQSKLELLMQTNPLSAEQAELMDELADAGQRMQRLNKSLLLLTKIENNQFPDVESISIATITENFIKQFEPQLEEKDIHLSFAKNKDVVVNANKMLVEILLSNLIGNAIRHNHTGGTIYIVLDADAFTISNSGRPDALDEQKLFRRFQKESTDTKSIGLGLEISRKIATLYQYNISYSFVDQQHRFTLSFS